jgi:hypothetical protein
LRHRYEVMIAMEAPWNPTQMVAVRSQWRVENLCGLMVRAHQRSTRDDAECAGDPARLVAIRAKRRAPAVEVVSRVGRQEGQGGKALAVAASAALRAFGIDFESVSPPVTAERLVVKVRRLSPGKTLGAARPARVR